jgi:hypothetical protein
VVKVRVPKTPKKAFNRARRPSTLLLGQIEHLEWAVLPASQRKPGQLPAQKVKSEAQAAERVAQLMKMLQESEAAQAAARTIAPGAAAAPPAPVVLPPLPKVALRRKRGPATRARKAARSAPRRRSRG